MVLFTLQNVTKYLLGLLKQMKAGSSDLLIKDPPFVIIGMDFALDKIKDLRFLVIVVEHVPNDLDILCKLL